jgi:hypothetical protein
MIIKFFDLTDEQILRGISLMNGWSFQNGSRIDTAFAYDRTLQRMALMWQECNKDRVLMKLTYADEIAALDEDIFVKYKGRQSVDAAAFYCPYVPLSTKGIIT